MTERKKCYIRAHGQDDEAVRRGLVWLVQEAREAGGETPRARPRLTLELAGYLWRLWWMSGC